MLKKVLIKSLFRITALTMAFLIFAVTGAQSYSSSAWAETLQRDQEAVTNTADNIVPEILTNEMSEMSNIIEEAPLINESQDSIEETQSEENYHNVNIGDLDIIGEDISPEESKLVIGALPWIGMNMGRLLGWLAGGAVAADVLVKSGLEVFEFAKELQKSKEKEKPKYFKVTITKKSLIIKEPLTEKQAIDFLSGTVGRDLWTPTYNDALGIASKVAKEIKGSVSDHHNHFLTGRKDSIYYNHFHAENVVFRTGHIFYGNTGLVGRQ
ncbi:hypothetical protein [Paenibacillus amylolyticus]|uniref:hypothetical protein n=1 Tax=Paenibacillus amylolyticus TaxID=1451 RepID=UPI00201DC102|nr:hypothetical protein [Paenibacillus amylolyticus]MCL6664186.1 hypothetical protein [Paenibacillus amylolyticus]